MPPGVEVKQLGAGQYQLSMPGMKEPLRVTTSAEFFDEHAESTELWSPGSPLFQEPEGIEDEPFEAAAARRLLGRS